MQKPDSDILLHKPPLKQTLPTPSHVNANAHQLTIDSLVQNVVRCQRSAHRTKDGVWHAPEKNKKREHQALRYTCANREEHVAKLGARCARKAHHVTPSLTDL